MRLLERPEELRTVAVLRRASAELESAVVYAPTPFALKSAHEAGPDTLRLLWVDADDAASARAVASALVEAEALPGGARVAIVDRARRAPGLLARLRSPLAVAPEDACAALLARGYVSIERGRCPNGAGVLVLARAPDPTAP